MWNITSWFGQRDAAHVSHAHQGIDVAMPLDTPVRAVDPGVVEQVTHEGVHGFGNAIWVKGPDGYRVVFGHLDQVFVKPGERVYDNEVIGLSGSTGHSTGSHLHIGVMSPDGQWVDPARHIEIQRMGISGSIKQWETNHIINPITQSIEDAVRQLAADFGHWALHVIGPISLVVCCVFLLGVILGIEKAPKRAMFWGVVASMAYGIDAP